MVISRQASKEITPMKPWFKFIPLIMLVTYFVTYDIMDQMSHDSVEQTSAQVASNN
ncbi:hypothetical protein SAMN04488244_10532 [Vibrio hangzhouensis]|uniref:Uncharacterized protein n=1 Tax=Vibrio hangzhouensis TaxID=462991 RepID=A0A1H5VW60_9VIBR|nr:hypothetical protein SAMN04488244_10532 [Vibrio hangzhouensis]